MLRKKQVVGWTKDSCLGPKLLLVIIQELILHFFMLLLYSELLWLARVSVIFLLKVGCLV